MQLANFQLPTKQDGFKSPLKTRVKLAPKPAQRSQSSNMVVSRNNMQVFKANEPNMPLRTDDNQAPRQQDYGSNTYKGTINNSTTYTRNGYQNPVSQTNTLGPQSNISLYNINQQTPNNPAYYTNPRAMNQSQVNPSGHYYRANSFNELTKSRDFGTRQQEMNDNMSVHSKVSTTSRNQLLRAVSINNEDHLYNLLNKEERLIAANTELINAVIKNLTNTKQNVVTNMGQNFKQRIGEIWTSYLAEQQKNPNPKIKQVDLDKDINTITQHFQENLIVKTQDYIEGLKEKVYTDLYASLAAKNNVRHYLDNEIKNLMENDFNAIQSKNLQLKKELEETKARFKAQIEQTAQKYDQMRETHMDLYDREFSFKLNGDDKLVRDTLVNGLPSLQAKKRKIDDKVSYINSKSDPKSVNQLRVNISELEAKLRL